MNYRSETQVTDVTFSMSGKFLFSGHMEQNAKIWDTLRGTAVGELKGHTRHISSIGLSSDGCAIATGSWDGSGRVSYISPEGSVYSKYFLTTTHLDLLRTDLGVRGSTEKKDEKSNIMKI